MYEYICSHCKGRCDPGEMIGSICMECLEDERLKQENSSKVVKIMNSPFYQMELDFSNQRG